MTGHTPWRYIRRNKVERELAIALRDLRDAFGPSAMPTAPLHQRRMVFAWKQANAVLKRYDAQASALDGEAAAPTAPDGAS